MLGLCSAMIREPGERLYTLLISLIKSVPVANEFGSFQMWTGKQNQKHDCKSVPGKYCLEHTKEVAVQLGVVLQFNVR